MAKTFGGLLPGIDAKVLAEELRDRVVEELDYSLEAQAQSAFAEEFAGDDRYVVPRVLEAGHQAIVTEWMPGRGSLATLIDRGTQEERDHFGELYARFMFEAPARTGMLHADPHPGNFRIIPGEDGRPARLGVLDYGAVARLPEGKMPASLGRLGRVFLEDDYEVVLAQMRRERFIKDNIRVSPHHLESYLGPFMEPARTPSFRFSRDFMRAQMQRVGDPRSPEMQTAVRLTLPPEYLLIHRTLTGGVGVLCQLEAEVPFRRILEELMPGFTDPVVSQARLTSSCGRACPPSPGGSHACTPRTAAPPGRPPSTATRSPAGSRPHGPGRSRRRSRSLRQPTRDPRCCEAAARRRRLPSPSWRGLGSRR